MYMAFLVKDLGKLQVLQKRRALFQVGFLGLSICFLFPTGFKDWFDAFGSRLQLNESSKFFKFSDFLSTFLVLVAFEMGGFVPRMLQNQWLKHLSLLSNGIIFLHSFVFELFDTKDFSSTVLFSTILLTLLASLVFYFVIEFPVALAMRWIWKRLQM